MKRDRVQARTDELLSAYLDGELNPNERARLEARLAAEPELRGRLDALRQTVALVQDLPTIPAPRNFLLTPAMVAQARPRPAPRRWLAPALSFASAASALLFAVALAGSLLTSGIAGGMASTRDTDEQALEVAMEQPAQEEQALVATAPAGDDADAESEGVDQRGADVTPAESPAAPPMPAAEAIPEAEASPEMLVAPNDMITETAPLTEGFGGGEVLPIATSTPASVGFAADETTTPVPSDQNDWSAATSAPELEESQVSPRSFSSLWLLTAGLALLTMVLVVAAVLSWRARRR